MPTDTSRHGIQCMSTDTTLSAQNNKTDTIICLNFCWKPENGLNHKKKKKLLLVFPPNLCIYIRKGSISFIIILLIQQILSNIIVHGYLYLKIFLGYSSLHKYEYPQKITFTLYMHTHTDNSSFAIRFIRCCKSI